MSDITADQATLRAQRYEELQRHRQQVQVTDDKWQDDLTAWKNRRRSVNSDIVKKKEEREQTEQETGRRSRTFREIQEERGDSDTSSSIGSRLRSLSSLDQEDVFETPIPAPTRHARARPSPTRSYTVDTPYTQPTARPPSPPRQEDPPSWPTARPVSPPRQEDPPSPSWPTTRPPSPPRQEDPPSWPTTRPVSPPRQEDPPAVTLSAADRPSLPPTEQGGDAVGSPVGSPTTPTSPGPSTISNPYAFTTTTSPGAGTVSNPYVSPTPAPMESSRSLALEPLSSAQPEETTTSTPASSFLPKVSGSRPPWAEEDAPSAGPVSRKAQPSPAEPSWPPGVSRVSASLPRSYQRSDSARLSSVVTPRPFGTQSTRLASLPRAYTTDDSLRRVNGETDVSRKPPSVPVAPSRYSQVMSSEDEARSVSSSAHSSNEDEEEDGEVMKALTTPALSVSPVPRPALSVSPVPPPIRSDDPIACQPKAETPPPDSVSPAPAKDAKQESYCDMRISLNQKPNSNRDFGFHADWDSTGARVTSIQPGSSAELCQLQVGDEVLAVNGHQVADMSYVEWKASLELALQQGSLAMDIRRHGRNSGPDTSSTSSVNTTTTSTINTTSLDFTSRRPLHSSLSAKDVPSHPIIDVASNGVNGGFRDDPVTMTNKDSEPISLKNLKRRSEFFEQGGSESAISDLAVPAIAPPSTRWSWDPEEERRRQEKWQREQERLLQEKYKRDQEKLEEEWLKDQQEADLMQGSKNQQEPEIPEVEGRSASPYSPLSQPTSPWEEQAEAQALEEERRRREEQERKRQEEERRLREEEERELQRLQEERKRREQQEEEERKAREEEELRWQRKREEEKEEARRRQEAEEQQRRREREREQQQWGQESYGIAQIQPELTMADRVKSKSTPQLDEAEKPETRVTGGGLGEASWGRDSQKKGQALSQAELERQQILQEMKKKTQLLTDNSWIRQRSISTTSSKENLGLPGPIRRGESLDNLDMPRSSWRSSWTPGTTSSWAPGSTSSIPNYSRPHSAMSSSTRSYGRPGSATLPSSTSLGSLRLGRGNPSSSWSQRSSSPAPPSPATSPDSSSEPHPPSQQRGRSVSGKKMCTLCDTALGKGAAMIIESLGLCYHLTCFQCIECRCDLGGSEAGAEVRIRNRQLYCNSCYMRVKSGQPTSM